MQQDAIIVARLDGAVISWNGGAEQMFGFSTAEMKTRSIFEITAHQRSSELLSVFEQARKGEPTSNLKLVGRAKDGRQFDALIDLIPIRDGHDGHERIVSAIIVARDLTAQRRTDRSRLETEGRWGAIIESAVDAMIVIDASGAVEVFNPAAERLFGYAADEVVGRNVSMLMPPPFSDEHDRYIANYLRTEHKKIIGLGREVTARRRDGSTFPVHLAVGEMSVAGERHFTGILHDLTPRMKLEARFREQNALAHLGEMAAVIAHEVKNPLAAVRGAIQVVGRRLPVGSQDGLIVAELVARIDALSGLLEDLLLFARAPQPQFVPVNLGELLRGTADLLSSDPLSSGVRVDITGEGGPVPGDPDLLRIVFQNLLLNAGQAMSGKGTVTVRWTSDGIVQRVSISDTGPGLSAAARESLFRPFFTTKARGTGLGLPTAKRLIELHGGSIVLESSDGMGTTVIVTLPAERAE